MGQGGPVTFSALTQMGVRIGGWVEQT